MTNLRASSLAAWKPSDMSMISQMRPRSGSTFLLGLVVGFCWVLFCRVLWLGFVVGFWFGFWWVCWEGVEGKTVPSQSKEGCGCGGADGGECCNVVRTLRPALELQRLTAARPSPARASAQKQHTLAETRTTV